MRFSIFSIFIILSVSIVFCSIFIFISKTDNSLAVLADSENQTSVLGAAGENVARLSDVNPDYIASFPQSEDRINIPPKMKAGAVKPDLADLTCLVMDKASGAVLLSQNEGTTTAIASISKLATALVFLEQGIDWERTYRVKAGDIVDGGKNNIVPGDEIKLKDLFFLSLVGSDNSATEALAHATGLSDKKFVEKINDRMKSLNLEQTNFSDPTGLSDANTSTAADVAKLAKAALERKEVREATLTKNYSFTTASGAKRSTRNTDILLDIFPQNGIKIVGGKTGYTVNAGYCFVGQFINESGHEIISVVLGGSDINSRFEATKHLVHWTYDNFVW